MPAEYPVPQLTKFCMMALCLAALGACERAAPEKEAKEAISTIPTAPVAVPSSVQSKARTLAAPVEAKDEIQIEALTGVWKVVGVDPGSNPKMGKDDPKLMGALMDVFPDQISWTYRPSDALAGSGPCLGPVSGLVEDGALAQDIRTALASARARFMPTRLSRPHHFLCGDGGDWGNEADFQQLGESRLAMRWPGDIVLVMDRIKQPAATTPPLPPTGAYEER